MTEQEAIDRIHSVYPTGRKNGVENMRALMARLGNPQNALPLVHVAGTNGKGSCCAMIERMLREAGYQTGLYTSPYIERYHERIRINGLPIAGDALAALVERVWPAVEACRRDGVHITEFELGTALAFAYFEQEHVDVAGGTAGSHQHHSARCERDHRDRHGSYAVSGRHDRRDCA